MNENPRHASIDEDTTIRGLNAIQEQQPIPDPPSMQSVRQKYVNLQSAIGELGNKVSGLLSQQQTEFLGAYRAHMTNVQRDFSDLHTEVDKKEAALAGSELVKRLEVERDYYRREALRLDEQFARKTKRERELTDRLREVEDDRDWLSRQLKVTLKEKGILEHRVEEMERNGSNP